MPRDFYPATAEQLVFAVEAVVVRPGCDQAFVDEFTNYPTPVAKPAVELAADLGLLVERAGKLFPVGALPRLFISQNQDQRAVSLRLVLEAYEPFVAFRNFMISGDGADESARKTKVTLDLSARIDEVKDALVSLGTFSKALVYQGGGKVIPASESIESELAVLSKGCDDLTSAEAFVRNRLGACADSVSRQEVVVPISNALVRALQRDGGGAVTEAGNGFESYLVEVGVAKGSPVDAKHGINSKIDELRSKANIPIKIQNMTRYLGHIRNAADHGTDADVGGSWAISPETGLEYVYITCSAIMAIDSWSKKTRFVL